jgi:hypothetical protein
MILVLGRGPTMSSILTDTKKLLGIASTDTSFDTDILVIINGAISVVEQLGVIATPFNIEDATDTWNDLLGDDEDKYANIKTYIFAKTRLLFDPPTNSFLVASLERQILEMESRLNYTAES